MVTPVDMVVFKTHARMTNLPASASFQQVWQSTYGRQGGLSALSMAASATFIRYFFILTSINSYLNFTQIKFNE
jgi:hypothetical protein